MFKYHAFIYLLNLLVLFLR